MGQWIVEFLYGYTATRDQVAEAQAVLERMRNTILLNPYWVSMQQHLTKNISQIVSESSKAVSRIVIQSY